MRHTTRNTTHKTDALKTFDPPFRSTPFVSCDTCLVPRGNRGQIMIEAIVALSALVVGFVGVFGLLSASLRYNRFVANDYTGTYLAAEGIEVVKNLLDSNVIAGRPWDCGFADGVYELKHDTQFKNADGTYTFPPVDVDCSQPVFTQDQSGNLYLDSVSHLYNYDASGIKTPFKRAVTIAILAYDDSGNPKEIQVNSHVSWRQGTGSRSINLEDRFFNWQR